MPNACVFYHVLLVKSTYDSGDAVRYLLSPQDLMALEAGLELRKGGAERKLARHEDQNQSAYKEGSSIC
jgi:hypothetical protein